MALSQEKTEVFIMNFPVVRDQYFYPVYLNELIDYYSYSVKEYVKLKNSAKEIADSIIKDVKYPFWHGAPDDTHVLNMYHGEYKWCKTVREDFWDRGSMVIGTNKVGDCDGSSIATVTCLRAFGVTPQNVYVVFGLVRDATTGTVLGGHAYVFCKDKSFKSDKYVLIETTLDTPPKQYPVVGSFEDCKKPYTYHNVIYDPEFLFNDQEFIQVKAFEMKKRKANFQKEEALTEAWQIPTKLYKLYMKSKIWKIKRALHLER